jgi:hypothetical protein
MNRSFIRWAKIISMAIGIGLGAGMLMPARQDPTQARNMTMATEHIPIVNRILEKDIRFTEIKLYAYTGNDGCLGVTGVVYSQRALDDLKKAVESTAPPVPVHWTVRVFPPMEEEK